MNSSNDGPSAYDILGVAEDVSDADLKRAYRQQSLKVHPDRHPDNPDAGQKFHELTQAYELLQDSVKRQALDASLRISRSRKARSATYDSKRKGLQEELEASERAAKKHKTSDAQSNEADKAQLAKVKEESRRLLEKKIQTLKERGARVPTDANHSKSAETTKDTPVRIRYSVSKFPTLVDAVSISALFSPFGAINSDLIVLMRKKSKKSGNADEAITALVPFISSSDALKVVSLSNQDQFKGMNISLAS